MPYLSIKGFYPDEKRRLITVLNLYRGHQTNEALAQITEAKPFNEIEPGELEITIGSHK